MQKFCAEYVAKQYIKTLDKFFWGWQRFAVLPHCYI